MLCSLPQLFEVRNHRVIPSIQMAKQTNKTLSYIAAMFLHWSAIAFCLLSTSCFFRTVSSSSRISDIVLRTVCGSVLNADSSLLSCCCAVPLDRCWGFMFTLFILTGFGVASLTCACENKMKFLLYIL